MFRQNNTIFKWYLTLLIYLFHVIPNKLIKKITDQGKNNKVHFEEQKFRNFKETREKRCKGSRFCSIRLQTILKGDIIVEA